MRSSRIKGLTVQRHDSSYSHSSQHYSQYKLILSTLVATLITGCGASQVTSELQFSAASEQSMSAIYGDDDRVDYYDAPRVLQNLTERAIVARVSANNVQFNSNGQISVSAYSLADTHGLCSGERFAEQPTLSSCSGTLIDDDLVLTAGHCARGRSDCLGTYWAFDYFYRGPDELYMEQDDFYACEEVLVSVTDRAGRDYAIIKLDRPVGSEREPAPVRLERVSNGEDLVLIGFPSGLPAKIDDGGDVSGEYGRGTPFFNAHIDSFSGNSGSGVFDDSGAVVGILTAGAQDYGWNGSCNEVVYHSASASGEHVVYASEAVLDLCDGGYPSERLCGQGSAVCGDGYCTGSETVANCAQDCEQVDLSAWSCNPNRYAYDGGDGCDCDCGLYDPDCDDPRQQVYNCSEGQVCGADAQCTEPGSGSSDVPDTNNPNTNGADNEAGASSSSTEVDSFEDGVTGLVDTNNGGSNSSGEPVVIIKREGCSALGGSSAMPLAAFALVLLRRRKRR